MGSGPEAPGPAPQTPTPLPSSRIRGHSSIGQILHAKAEKSIFLCDYLPSRETQYEVHEGLNVVENWNATNDFICYGRQGELATNSREQQEIVTLSLQLLQNCLMLINTILVERTIEQEGLWERLSAEDFRALTPLFHGHINPYGQFTLDLARPSFLEVA